MVRHLDYQTLKDEASQIDCCQFLKRFAPLQVKNTITKKDIQNYSQLSKSKKIKLFTKNQD